MDLNLFIADYGVWFYPATFVFTFLEGETFVIFAGAAAQQGLLDIRWLVLAAWLGSFSGDQLYFFIGRRYGQRLLERFPKHRGAVDIALGFLQRFDVGFILSFRFIYGIRNVSSFAMGTSSLSYKRFLVLNFIAAGLWAVSFAGAGYLLGHAFEAMLGSLIKQFGLAMLAVFLVVIGMVLALHKRLQRSEAKLLQRKEGHES